MKISFNKTLGFSVDVSSFLHLVFFAFSLVKQVIFCYWDLISVLSDSSRGLIFCDKYGKKQRPFVHLFHLVMVPFSIR